ncbi:MAG: Stealth CR1 domain-containing protein [Muribaculaceae bacterium]|nr:Stealth CR1 domain-containing protein [Muribaculaceae bacterium]
MPPIDIVVTWVDMNDPQWKKDFAQYSHQPGIEDNGINQVRFRDYGLFRFWFRGVETFAPWVRKIHFVTSGPVPEWLNTDNPKINVVKHSDYIPAEFLPTFNSTVIERYMHKIPGLSDNFIYFNDDFFILKPIGPDRFFQNGLPCDIAVFQYNPAWSQWYRKLKNNIRLINLHFKKKEVMKKWRHKWYTPLYGKKGFGNKLWKLYPRFITLRVHHNAQPYLKETFEKVWNACGAELKETSSFRFRDSKDYSPELFRTWQICEGNFEPYNTYGDTKMFPLMVKPLQALKAVRNQEYSLICLNDNKRIKNYEVLMQHLRDAFEFILPEKSSFEL